MAVGAIGLAGVLFVAQLIVRPATIKIAFANSMTGARGLAGTESYIATQLYIDQINRAGGIHGRQIELQIFDDKSDPATARANAEAIADSPCLAVLGHFNSNVSMAASPVYEAAGLAAVSGTSLADDLTAHNPIYFRAQAQISDEARSIAEYIRLVWHPQAVGLLLAADSNGRNFRQGFVSGDGDMSFAESSFEIGPAGAASLNAAVASLLKQREPGVVVVGAGADTLSTAIKAIRRHGYTGRVIAAANTGDEELMQEFSAEPEQQRHAGFFTENLFVAAPILFDSTGPTATAFGESYAVAANKRPSWIGAGAYDAAHMLVEALRRSRLHDNTKTKTEDRAQVRDHLAAFNEPKSAVPGLTGPLFFNGSHSLTRSIRVGSLLSGRFITAPQQLVLVDPEESVDIQREVGLGHIVTAGDQNYWHQRVVYTGIDINRLNRIDVRNTTFNVDFYLWMRFSGDNDDPPKIELPDLVESGAFDQNHPAESSRDGDLNYRLYRIKGDFKAFFDLRDYPFDA